MKSNNDEYSFFDSYGASLILINVTTLLVSQSSNYNYNFDHAPHYFITVPFSFLFAVAGAIIGKYLPIKDNMRRLFVAAACCDLLFHGLFFASSLTFILLIIGLITLV